MCQGNEEATSEEEKNQSIWFGYSLVAERLSSVCEVLGSIASTKETKKSEVMQAAVWSVCCSRVLGTGELREVTGRYWGLSSLGQ